MYSTRHEKNVENDKKSLRNSVFRYVWYNIGADIDVWDTKLTTKDLNPRDVIKNQNVMCVRLTHVH